MSVELQNQLKEAESAYHRLMTGQSVVMFKDSNGEQVQYSAVSANKLLGYILSLKQQLGLPTGIGPMRAWF